MTDKPKASEHDLREGSKPISKFYFLNFNEQRYSIGVPAQQTVTRKGEQG